MSRPAPLHILLVHQLFITHEQAGGTRHYELACRWLEAGHRVTVLAGQRSYLTGEAHAADGVLPPGLHVERVGTLPFAGGGFVLRLLNFLAFTAVALWTALRVGGVDVVVGTTPPLFQSWAARLAARLRGVPFVLEVRDLWPDFAVELGVLSNPWLIGLSRALERDLYRGADHVVVNSPGFVDHVRDRGAARVTVVPNGVDAGLFDPEDPGDGFRRAQGLQDCFLILYAGAHGPPNDLGTVLDAAEALRQRDDLRWVLIGDGREKPRLAQEVARRGLTNVLLLPPASKAEMPGVLAAADLCLAILAPLPLFKTVYPNKVFDYMAAGRPVLLAIDGVIRQVVEEAEAGSFVTPGDPAALAAAVLRYADQASLGRAQGRSGREHVERHYRRDRQATRFLEVLEGVTAGF